MDTIKEGPDSTAETDSRSSSDGVQTDAKPESLPEPFSSVEVKQELEDSWDGSEVQEQVRLVHSTVKSFENRMLQENDDSYSITDAETAKEACKHGDTAAGGVEGETVDPKPRKELVLKTMTESGHVFEMRLDQDRPKSFTNERAQRMWDQAVYCNALRLKSQIEEGEVTLEDIRKQTEHGEWLDKEKKLILKKDCTVDLKKKKLKWLILESRLVELDTLIKSTISVAKAEPDKCLDYLDEMLSLTIYPLMLKKHPYIVEVIKRLRRYVGNVQEWNYSEEEKAKFAVKAGQIRDKAEHVFNKFKTMFTVPEGRTFLQEFSDHVTLFKKRTSHLDAKKLCSLTVEPIELTYSYILEDDGIEKN